MRTGGGSERNSETKTETLLGWLGVGVGVRWRSGVASRWSPRAARATVLRRRPAADPCPLLPSRLQSWTLLEPRAALAAVARRP